MEREGVRAGGGSCSSATRQAVDCQHPAVHPCSCCWVAKTTPLEVGLTLSGWRRGSCPTPSSHASASSDAAQTSGLKARLPRADLALDCALGLLLAGPSLLSPRGPSPPFPGARDRPCRPRPAGWVGREDACLSRCSGGLPGSEEGVGVRGAFHSGVMRCAAASRSSSPALAASEGNPTARAASMAAAACNCFQSLWGDAMPTAWRACTALSCPSALGLPCAACISWLRSLREGPAWRERGGRAGLHPRSPSPGGRPRTRNALSSFPRGEWGGGTGAPLAGCR